MKRNYQQVALRQNKQKQEEAREKKKEMDELKALQKRLINILMKSNYPLLFKLN